MKNDPAFPSAGVRSLRRWIADGNCPTGSYVRFHGRNQATWNARVEMAAERFKYLYTEKELAEWVEPLHHLGQETQTTYAIFNNCYADYAPRNARQMMDLLQLPPASEGGEE